jgi:hypothetical protein
LLRLGQQGNGAGTSGQGRKQLAANGQCGGAAATGQKAEVADFHEPAGHKQKPSNELHRMQHHLLGWLWSLESRHYTGKGDSFLHDKPRMWSEKKLGTVSLCGNYDLAPEGKPIAALMPADTYKGTRSRTLDCQFLAAFPCAPDRGRKHPEDPSAYRHGHDSALGNDRGENPQP